MTVTSLPDAGEARLFPDVYDACWRLAMPGDEGLCLRLNRLGSHGECDCWPVLERDGQSPADHR